MHYLARIKMRAWRKMRDLGESVQNDAPKKSRVIIERTRRKCHEIATAFFVCMKTDLWGEIRFGIYMRYKRRRRLTNGVFWGS